MEEQEAEASAEAQEVADSAQEAALAAVATEEASVTDTIIITAIGAREDPGDTAAGTVPTDTGQAAVSAVF